MPTTNSTPNDKLLTENVALVAERDLLRAALSALQSEQNGPPLIRHQKRWEAAMALTENALSSTTQPAESAETVNGTRRTVTLGHRWIAGLLTPQGHIVEEWNAERSLWIYVDCLHPNDAEPFAHGAQP